MSPACEPQLRQLSESTLTVFCNVWCSNSVVSEHVQYLTRDVLGISAISGVPLLEQALENW